MISGAKFSEVMYAELINDSLGTGLPAFEFEFIDATQVYASFSLSSGAYTGNWTTAGLPTGFYDVKLTKSDGSFAILENGFEIVEGGTPQILVNVQYPATTRPNRIVPVTIEIANSGDVDVPIPVRAFICSSNDPIALTISDLDYRFDNLRLEFREAGGPQHVLSPGASSTITVYVKAPPTSQNGVITFAIIPVE